MGWVVGWDYCRKQLQLDCAGFTYQHKSGCRFCQALCNLFQTAAIRPGMCTLLYYRRLSSLHRARVIASIAAGRETLTCANSVARDPYATCVAACTGDILTSGASFASWQQYQQAVAATLATHAGKRRRLFCCHLLGDRYKFDCRCKLAS